MKADEVSLSRKGSLNACAWQAQLFRHLDRTYVQTLLFIIEHEAKVEYRGSDQMILSKNLSSANEASESLQADLKQQFRCDRLIEVHHIPQRFIFSSLNLVPNVDGR